MLPIQVHSGFLSSYSVFVSLFPHVMHSLSSIALLLSRQYSTAAFLLLNTTYKLWKKSARIGSNIIDVSCVIKVRDFKLNSVKNIYI